MLHIVFAGNPGVGKSFLVNTLVGHVAFSTGVRLSAAHLSPQPNLTVAGTSNPTNNTTSVLNTITWNGLKYSDTPGLDDVRVRATAAREISAAINAETELKLIFVVTLESGRIRPADVATIDVILSAVESTSSGVTIDHSYSIIVNRCDSKELELLEDDSVREFVTSQFGKRFKLKHSLFMPNVDLPTETRNESSSNQHIGLLPHGEERTKLSSFVFDAPVLSVAPPVTVRHELYDGARENAVRELRQLREELDEISAMPSWLWYMKAVTGFFLALVGRAAWLAMRAFV